MDDNLKEFVETERLERERRKSLMEMQSDFRMTVLDNTIVVLIIALLVTLAVVTPLKSMTLECEHATIKATEIYAEFLDGKRTWKSTIPYDKKMEEVCK